MCESEGQTGVCEIGHEDRQELEALLKVPRKVEPLKNVKMKISLGPKNVKKTSVKELEEEFKATEEGQRILRGGSVTVPVLDHVKEKFKMKSVETSERMKKDLMYIHDEMLNDGFSQEDVTMLVKQDKNIMAKVDPEVAEKATELYSKYQKFESEMAEVKVKEAWTSCRG